MSEQQAGWTSDGPDFEYLEAGPFVLEVARGRVGTFRWSTAVRLGDVEHILSRGEAVTRFGARYWAVSAAHDWLAGAGSALPPTGDDEDCNRAA